LLEEREMERVRQQMAGLHYGGLNWQAANT
jgi:hypothetical protein